MLKKCLQKFKAVTAFHITNGVIRLLASIFAIVYFKKLIIKIYTKCIQDILLESNIKRYSYKLEYRKEL